MTYQYASNYDDFLAAQRLNRRGNWRQASFILFLWIIPMLGLIALVLTLSSCVFNLFTFDSSMTAPSILVIFFGVWLPLSYQLQLRRLYKQMKNGRPEGVPVEFELTADEVISRVPGMSEGRFRRAALHGFIEDEHVAMLYVTKRRFLLLPKRMMPAPAWAELRGWLGPIAAGRP